jgi:hypothetical protein
MSWQGPSISPEFDDSLFDREDVEYVKGEVCPQCSSRLIRTVIPNYEIVCCSSKTCHYAVANSHGRSAVELGAAISSLTFNAPPVITAPPRSHPEGMIPMGRGLFGAGWRTRAIRPAQTRYCDLDKTGTSSRRHGGAGAVREKKTGDGLNENLGSKTSNRRRRAWRKACCGR